MFKLNPGEYIESTISDGPEDGNIVGMYLTEDLFQVYRRNEDSSLFQAIWTQGNAFKDDNLGVWSLKVYRDTGNMRLDGGPTPEGSAAGPNNGTQWTLEDQTGVKPFRMSTSGVCPYVFLRDSSTDGDSKKQFIHRRFREGPDSVCGTN
jgi:hypothetical protein